MTPQRDTAQPTTSPNLLRLCPSCPDRATRTRHQRRDRRLAERYPCLVARETGDADVVVPLEVQLKVLDFEGVPAAVLGEAASERGDGVDEFVGDVEK